LPARFRDIRRALLDYGITAEPPSSGSHWKLRDATGKAYTLPCHNGDRTEISDVYLRALCRAFGLDWHEFMRKL